MSQTFEQLVSKFGVPQETLEQARQQKAAQGGYLRNHLIALNAFTEETFAQNISETLRVPYSNLENKTISDDLLAMLPREKAEKYLALPLELDVRHRRLTITMANPTDMLAIDELKFVVGYTVIPHYTPEDELSEAIRREYARLEEKQAVATARAAHPSPTGIQRRMIEIAPLATIDATIAPLLGAFIQVAHAKRASELHIDTDFTRMSVRLRIDGKLSELTHFPKKLAAPLITRLKRVLGIDIAESSNISQKSYATVKLQNQKELDLSCQMFTTAQNEHVVMKLKERHALPTLTDFDLEANALHALQQALAKPYGVVLVTGKARSGLTTTLYTLLKTLSTPQITILSVEDPVECLIEEITQGQICEATGDTYEDYLFHAATHHPDVLMIDKLGDATIVQKSLALSSATLILAAFPAMDAANAAMKLIFMSSPREVIDHVHCIISQRLVRKICDSCKEKVGLPEAHREKLGFSPEDSCYAGKGCETCKYTGYKGVVAIFEVMPLTEEIKQAIIEACTVNDLRDLQASHHILSLRDDGMRKVKQGVTTVQEVLKATMLQI